MRRVIFLLCILSSTFLFAVEKIPDTWKNDPDFRVLYQVKPNVKSIPSGVELKLGKKYSVSQRTFTDLICHGDKDYRKTVCLLFSDERNKDDPGPPDVCVTSEEFLTYLEPTAEPAPSDGASTDSELEKEIRFFAEEGREFLDPDCIWRTEINNQCPPVQEKFIPLVNELDKLSMEYNEQTLHYFDVRHNKKGKIRRDFGGVWQGWALEKLQLKVTGNWLVDFSGDMLLNAPLKGERQFIISDAVFDKFKYATVKIEKGYFDTSVSTRLEGGKVRVPDGLEVPQDDKQILKVVLFAIPRFSGSRLDAWSTAIAAGGTKVLEHLWSLKEYKGQWGYFYFENSGHPHCSDNIHCDLTGKEKTVEVNL
jgi:hypothetical protein